MRKKVEEPIESCSAETLRGLAIELNGADVMRLKSVVVNHPRTLMAHDGCGRTLAHSIAEMGGDEQRMALLLSPEVRDIRDWFGNTVEDSILRHGSRDVRMAVVRLKQLDMLRA